MHIALEDSHDRNTEIRLSLNDIFMLTLCVAGPSQALLFLCYLFQ